MKRHTINPRPDWPQQVEQLGLTYHSHEDGPYWDESACYELTASEVDALELAGNTVHRLCLEAINAVIENGWWYRLNIPQVAIPSIRRSWERDDFSIYGRFDFAFDGSAPPKLLEYNADTPTALVEAAIAQWFWLREKFPRDDQFNSIHERLVEAWSCCSGKTIHFSSVKDHPEDEQTVLYMRDTCEQAGIKTKAIYVEDIGWHGKQRRFVDLDGLPIERCFKLYPWEWLWQEEFGNYVAEDGIQFIEPAWKMLLSNKALLPILWELFPGHPNLLPAYEHSESFQGNFVRKPKLSREGSNVALIQNGVVVEETDGNYGEDGFVYQALAQLPDFDGNHPVCGVWIVDHDAVGLGIREDSRRITGNLSRFVPHFFKPAKR